MGWLRTHGRRIGTIVGVFVLLFLLTGVIVRVGGDFYRWSAGGVQQAVPAKTAHGTPAPTPTPNPLLIPIPPPSSGDEELIKHNRRVQATPTP